ncbi:MAG: copper chaperone PCu(A)C [Alphaproteobacteria bacterium]|nr:copper chaperone PCu(A)C [Alphaproteobacteria bacterium]
MLTNAKGLRMKTPVGLGVIGIVTLILTALVAMIVLSKGPPLEAHDAYAFATAPSQKNGAVFLQIQSHRFNHDRLLSATAGNAADRVELHAHVMSGNTMSMRKVDALDLPPGAVTTLSPGGDHVMLMDLKAPLQEGQVFKVILRTERSGVLTVPVLVRAPGDVP